jgi:glycosyltransferase involved in cell wall biosynthesis
MTRGPLISVIVITYNSAGFILETLNSIRDQHYESLELLISDDCSADGTVELCRQWLELNGGRFVRTQLLVPERNQGIPANCNQGLKAATGEWVKYIAGDDALFPGTFEHAANFINAEPQARIFASSFASFQDTFSESNRIENRDDSDLAFYGLSAERQHFLLVRNNYLHAGTVFLQRSLLEEVGGFNEKYRLLEDHPMWLSITARGQKVFYMPAYTLMYRLHGNSVFSHTGTEKLFNNFYLKRRGFELDMIYPHLRWYESLSYHYSFYLKRSFDALYLNRRSTFCGLLYRFFNAVSPMSILYSLKNKRLSNS